MNYKWPCCGEMTLESLHENDICPVCGWEDDWFDSLNPDHPGTFNYTSLNEARAIYWQTGMSLIEYERQKLELHKVVEDEHGQISDSESN